MARGRLWESVVLDLLRRQSGYRLRVPLDPELWVGPEDWQTATPDAWAVDPDGGDLHPIEAKTDRSPAKWGAEGYIDSLDAARGRVRLDYWLQVQWQLHCSCRHTGILAVLLPYYDLRVYTVERDDPAMESIIATVREWYHTHVLGGDAPDTDSSPACRVSLTEDYEPGPELREATADEGRLILHLQELRARKKQIEADEAFATNELLRAAHGYSGLHLGDPKGPRCSIVSSAGRSTLDAKALRKARPDLASVLDEYTKTGRPSASVRLGGFPTTEEE
jgi:hypothetical protein